MCVWVKLFRLHCKREKAFAKCSSIVYAPLNLCSLDARFSLRIDMNFLWRRKLILTLSSAPNISATKASKQMTTIFILFTKLMTTQPAPEWLIMINYLSLIVMVSGLEVCVWRANIGLSVTTTFDLIFKGKFKNKGKWKCPTHNTKDQRTRSSFCAKRSWTTLQQECRGC